MKVELLTNKDILKEHYVARFLESVGRISHNSKGRNLETTRKFMEMIIKLGHLSIMEHFSISFKVSDISRACATQLLRHRHCAFTQESMRYVKLDPRYVLPDTIKNNEKLFSKYKNFLLDISSFYKELLDNGVPKEDARFILPLSTVTSLVITTNIREWLHIINIRVTKQAQWEVRKVVSAIWKELYQVEPFIFDIKVISLLPAVEDLQTKKEIFSTFSR